MSTISLERPPAIRPQRDSRDSRLWLQPRAFLWAVGVWTLLHLAFAIFYQLVPDEAYYWVWSRHLALGYLDHPPMVAYLIRLGTLLGNSEFAVRWPMTLIAAANLLLIGWTARRLIGHKRAGAFVSLAMLCSPIFTVLGSVATPDTPVYFFESAALVIVLSIFSPDLLDAPRHAYDRVTEYDSLARGPRWLLFGLLLGLAVVSKYTGAFVGFAVLGALLWSAEGRAHLRTRWPWLGATVSLAVFSPVVWWNYQRNWASFVFQIGHAGASSDDRLTLRFLGDFIGGQVAACTPVLFFLCAMALGVYWSRRGLPMVQRILLLASTLPLAVVAISSLRQRPEINWPVFAYLPALLLVGFYLAEHWTARIARAARVAIAVELLFTIVMHIPQLFWVAAPQIPTSAWDQQYGWPQLAAETVRRAGNLPVITGQYQDASELSFYMPGHPMIWPLPYFKRLTAFDFFPGYVPASAYPQILVVAKIPKTGPIPRNAGVPDGFDQSEAFPLDVTWRQHEIRRSVLTVADRVATGESRAAANASTAP